MEQKKSWKNVVGNCMLVAKFGSSSEAYSEPSQMSKMELFVKIVNGFSS